MTTQLKGTHFRYPYTDTVITLIHSVYIDYFSNQNTLIKHYYAQNNIGVEREKQGNQVIPSNFNDLN